MKEIISTIYLSSVYDFLQKTSREEKNSHNYQIYCGRNYVPRKIQKTSHEKKNPHNYEISYCIMNNIISTRVEVHFSENLT